MVSPTEELIFWVVRHEQDEYYLLVIVIVLI